MQRNQHEIDAAVNPKFDTGRFRRSRRRIARARASISNARTRRAETPATIGSAATDAAGGPEEIDTVQEADEQRRVAERRQRAADISDQDDEEHDDMDAMARAARRRADTAGSGSWQRRWFRRSSPSPAPSASITRQITGVRANLPVTRMPPATMYSANRRMMKLTYSPTAACTNASKAVCGPKPIASGTSARTDQQHCDFAVMRVPEFREQQRPDRDGKQQTRKGQRPMAMTSTAPSSAGAANAACGQIAKGMNRRKRMGFRLGQFCR